MKRQAVLERAARHFDGGVFLADLARLVAVPSESQEARGAPHLAAYLTDHLRPALEHMGFLCQVLVNPAPGGPLLLAERTEDPDLPTVLVYGHGDVVRGMEEAWLEGLSPWALTERDGRLYGRGVADNKGQHAINLAALGLVIAERGRLGFNAKVLIETSEEIGSPGLREICESHQRELAADLLLASDGPRLLPDQPTIVLGSRGALNFDLVVELRDSGHHSGNWGGLLANPAIILAHAIATIASKSGAIQIQDLKPRSVPPTVRRALADLPLAAAEGEPAIDPDWGEPGLSAAEKVLGWNSFEVLAWPPAIRRARSTRSRPRPRPTARSAIPSTASRRASWRRSATRSARPVSGGSRCGLPISPFSTPRAPTPSTAGWRSRGARSSAPPAACRSCCRTPAAALPNDGFAEVLGLPTVWVPHAHRGCRQHAPNEHALPAVLREGLLIMTGLFWDLGENQRHT